MGMLIKGKWVKKSVITSDKDGSYNRQPRSFREFISCDHPIYTPDSNRYHLYISYACPWACRALIYRSLKSLEAHISFSVVSPDMLENGWEFDPSYPGCTHDHLFNFKYLRDVYLKADNKATTSVTVPVLWDKKTDTIVNNESSEIIRMFNSGFNKLTNNDLDLYPIKLKNKIDLINKRIYENINNGVYKVGFAKTQSNYDFFVKELFVTLDYIDDLLGNDKFLVGDIITEADLRLIPTLLRFDVVYFTHFKCNLKRIIDYKNIRRYMQDLYNIEAIKKTTNFDHIKRHYFYSHSDINPYQIVPAGPVEIF